MKRQGLLVVAVLLMAALPAFGKTYKYFYADPCTSMWPAVKAVLATVNYEVKQTDDAAMHADYEAKHSVHADISGTVLQRTNHVTLVPKGSACEMQIVSNWSGWGHNDQGDFKTRVEDAMKDIKAGRSVGGTAPDTGKPAEAAKPDAAKPEAAKPAADAKEAAPAPPSNMEVTVK